MRRFTKLICAGFLALAAIPLGVSLIKSDKGLISTHATGKGTQLDPLIVDNYEDLYSALLDEEIDYIRVDEFQNDVGKEYATILDSHGKSFALAPYQTKHLTINTDISLKTNVASQEIDKAFSIVSGDLTIDGCGSFNMNFHNGHYCKLFEVNKGGTLTLKDSVIFKAEQISEITQDIDVRGIEVKGGTLNVQGCQINAFYRRSEKSPYVVPQALAYEYGRVFISGGEFVGSGYSSTNQRFVSAYINNNPNRNGGKSVTDDSIFNITGGTFDGFVVNHNPDYTVLIPANYLCETGYSFVYDDGEEDSCGSKNAIWYRCKVVKTTCTASFHANGGDGEPMENILTDTDRKVILPNCNYTAPDGLEFKGWALNDNNGEPMQPGTVVKIDNDSIFYAIWGDYEHVSVTYVDTKSSTMFECFVRENATIPVRSYRNCFFKAPLGYEFSHWKINSMSDSAPTIEGGQDYTVGTWEDPVTFYAVLIQTHELHRIIFDASGGDGEMPDVEWIHNTKYVLPECNFTKENYIFKCWRNNNTGEFLQPGDEIYVMENLSISVEWCEPKSLSCNDEINVNKGTFLSDYNYGFVITNEDDSTFEIDNSKVKFYSSDSSFVDKELIENPDEYQFDTIGTLYFVVDYIGGGEPAHLTISVINAFVVVFDANGGTGSMNKVYVEENDLYELPECSYEPPEEKAFDYWDVDGNEFTPGEEISVDADTTVIAMWKDNPRAFVNAPQDGETYVSQTYTVTFSVNFKAYGFAVYEKIGGVRDILHSVEHVYEAGEAISYELAAQSEEVTKVYSIDVYWNNECTLYLTCYDFSIAWNSSEVMVSYYPGTGASGTPDSDYVHIGDYIQLADITNFAFEGPEHTIFAGWKIGETIYQPGVNYQVTEATIITAQWEDLPCYTISFNHNGGDGEMVDEVFYGDKYTLPECTINAPSGYEFAGWKVNNAGELLQPDAKIDINIDIVLYAQWSLIACEEYAITFDAGEGTGTMDALAQEAGEYVLPTCGFTAPEGQTFAGWKVNGEGELLQPGDKINVDSAITLVAFWKEQGIEPEPVKYTISFNDNGGSGTMVNVIVDENETYTLPDCGFTAPEGKEFAGWKANDDETLRQPGYEITVTGNVTITAMWKDKEVVPEPTYTVSFDANGGTGVMEPETDIVGVYVVSYCGFEAPEGQKFAGWKINGEGDLLQPGDSIEVSSNVVLVAQWEDIVYRSVTFNVNGGTGEQDNDDSLIPDGSSFELPECTLTAPEGKEFDCWEVDGVTYNPGDFITMDSDKTIKAIWKDKAVDPVDPVDPQPQPEPTPAKKKGCGGSVIAASTLISIVSLAGVALLFVKKKQD